jgi:hypothetical protein
VGISRTIHKHELFDLEHLLKWQHIAIGFDLHRTLLVVPKYELSYRHYKKLVDHHHISKIHAMHDLYVLLKRKDEQGCRPFFDWLWIFS